MQAIEIARRMAELGQTKEALRAYTLAAHNEGLTPEEELEAAVYILQAGGNYQISYTCFLNLYRRGLYQEETLALLTGAFYEPNIKELRGRYERNVKLLKKYPYLFRKDFPSFEELPIRFYPYSDGSYIPFFPARREFGEFIDIKKPVVSRNFFRDLEKPVLASEVYSQYELEYLRDNVRRSDYVGRENHVYLHYEDWGIFCSYLQCWNMRPLLEEEKIVFLMGEEIAQYPIDFKERFGIDYSQYPLKPVGIREVTRMIWLSQILSHNGIFFFTEVLDGHPNILCAPAHMLDDVVEGLGQWKKNVKGIHSVADFPKNDDGINHFRRELYLLKGVTDKDILAAYYLGDKRCSVGLDPAARITPALLFSPHFGNIHYRLRVDTKQNLTVLYSPQYEKIRNSPIFKNFKYIKSVAPFRRPTTSSAAAVRYMWNRAQESWEELEKEEAAEDTKKETPQNMVGDAVSTSVLNRSYLIDWQDRLFQDSVLVRFEDGKLNPKATFTALAEFLDLPYAESMTYCSQFGELNPEGIKGDARGFDTRAVFETHEEFMGENERYFLEYFLRDVYQEYGYDFHYYDGQPMDEQRVEELCGHFDTIDRYIEASIKKARAKLELPEGFDFGKISKEEIQMRIVECMSEVNHENRLKTGKTLLRGLHFINNHAQELHMMPLLKLDPALLEQPLYH